MFVNQAMQYHLVSMVSCNNTINLSVMNKTVLYIFIKTNLTIDNMLRITQLKSNDLKHSRYINPLSPHDALKHHFTSLKKKKKFLQPRILE